MRSVSMSISSGFKKEEISSFTKNGVTQVTEFVPIKEIDLFDSEITKNSSINNTFSSKVLSATGNNNKKDISKTTIPPKEKIKLLINSKFNSIKPTKKEKDKINIKSVKNNKGKAKVTPRSFSINYVTPSILTTEKTIIVDKLTEEARQIKKSRVNSVLKRQSFK